jgi:hypothetical protein
MRGVVAKYVLLAIAQPSLRAMGMLPTAICWLGTTTSSAKVAL